MQQEAEKINIEVKTLTRSPVTRTGKNYEHIQAIRKPLIENKQEDKLNLSPEPRK